MGIRNLMKLLESKITNLTKDISTFDISGKKIAIDTSIIIYQYVSAVKTHSDMTSNDGKSTAHIMAILIKTLNYLKAGIIPVYVFDGKPPELKMKILADRLKIKKDAIEKLVELEHDTTMNKETLEQEKAKLIRQSITVTHNDMAEVKEIVELLGVPYIQAPEEADCQCAYLSINDMVDYVASEDMDLLTFGSKIIIKNFMKKGMYTISLNDILTGGNITMDQFIDICILMGCDYTDTIEGIGMKRAWDLIIEHGSIEELIINEDKIKKGKYKLPDNFRYVEAREYFKNHRHIDNDKLDLSLKIPRLDELKALLISKYNFNPSNIETMIKFLRIKYNIPSNEPEIDEDPFIDDDIEILKKNIKTKPSKGKKNNHIDIIGDIDEPKKKSKIKKQK